MERGESRAFDKFDRFAQFEASKGRTLASLLDEFATLRQDNLRELAALNVTDTDLDRRGRHPELGVVTLRQLLATWTAHDLDHVVQIARALARQYSDEVGPWRSVPADHQRNSGLSRSLRSLVTDDYGYRVTHTRPSLTMWTVVLSNPGAMIS